VRTVTLKYHREGDSILSSGSITVEGHPPMAFGQEGFSRMMRLVHLQLQPGDRLLFHRDDRPGLVPIEMEPEFVEMLRTDPVRAIKSLTYEPDHLTEKNPLADALRRPLPVQRPVDPMTDHFHGTVHYGRRNGDIECPGCGMWSTVYDVDRVFVCRKKCLALFRVLELGPHMATFDALELLSKPFDRFYITEKWNPNSPWMSRHDLEELNRKWQQIKEST